MNLVKYTNWFIHSSYFLIVSLVLLLPEKSCSQPLKQTSKFTRQDSLRGSIGKGRDWWNVTKYDISVSPSYKQKSIAGTSTIHFKTIKASQNPLMQIDLQSPMRIDSIYFVRRSGRGLPKPQIINRFRKDGNAWFVNLDGSFTTNQESVLIIHFSGKPREAINPPWDGGWIWKKDEKGNPWMTVACQGLGASVWYPCKDHQGDEPDLGASVSITVPDSLSAIGNGKLANKKSNGNGTSTWTWEVKNPINNYNIVPYIGKYAHISDNYIGETEKNLSLDYWVLDYNKDKAKKQFDRDVPRMLKAFEYWFGPYPFYEDGFKLVETPHLGMEHQSAIAYGNHYMDGYLGSDLSGSGWGLKWDYIIIHEAGHEWFGNNITTNDIADMWVHEGFTMYSEILFIDYWYGTQAGNAYVQGLRPNIDNDKPLIGPYGVNQEGSGDMYNKGANLLHTIRQIINNDTVFRKIMRGLNKDFYHRTVDSRQVEAYISKHSGKDFSKVFDQYLRTVKIPALEIKESGTTLLYRWTNCVTGFNMPVKLKNDGKWLYPTTQWKKLPIDQSIREKAFTVDPNFYVTLKTSGTFESIPPPPEISLQ